MENRDIENQIIAGYLEARGDDDKIRQWFNKYNYYKLTDIARALRINMSHLYRLRKQCGLVIPGPKRIHKIKTYEKLESIPEDWKNGEWLLPAIEKYGTKQVAEKAGVTAKTVYITLHKLGRRVITEKHSCDNVDWLHEHYYAKRLNIVQMSKLAGVSEGTIKQWLIKYGIDRRFTYRYPMPMWFREFSHQLLNNPLVTKIVFRNAHIRVSYKSHIVEKYFFAGQIRVRRKSFFIRAIDTKQSGARGIVYTYGEGMLGERPYPMHIKINRDFKDMNTIEKRLTIHSFLAAITTRKWEQMRHPPDVIASDLERCKTVDLDRYYIKGAFHAYAYHVCKEPAGQYLAEHFFKFTFGPYICCLKYSNARYFSLMRFLKKRKKKEVNFRNFLRFICTDYKTKLLYGRRFRFYRDFGALLAILKKLNISGTILDLSPGYGYNALSAAMGGYIYKYPKGHKIEEMLKNGFADYVGLKHSAYDGGEVDALVFFNHYLPDMSIIKKYYNVAKRIIVYVPGSQKDMVVTKYKPEYLIRYNRTVNREESDFLAIW